MFVPERKYSEKDLQKAASRGCRPRRDPTDTNVSGWYAHRLDELQPGDLLGIRYPNGGAELPDRRRRLEFERCHVRAKRPVWIRSETFGHVGQGAHDVQVR